MESRLEVGGPVSDRRELSGERGVGHNAQAEHHQVHVAWRRDLEGTSCRIRKPKSSGVAEGGTWEHGPES